MRYKPVLRALGYLLLCEAALMLPSLAVSVLYGEGDAGAFVLSIVLLLAVGGPLVLFIKRSVRELYAREGFAIVGLGWILLSLFGMLPFLFAGVIASPVDAFFETVSGFTTTGSSILPFVEGLPHGVLFWRSFTHWVGGMGVLVFTIALLPQLGLRNMELLRAESPGPNPEKLLPKIRETAKILYTIYFGLSALCFGLLLLTGMHPFDSAVNMFGAAGTGGFSVLNASIGGYNNPAAEMILGVFMLLFGVNFTVYFMLLLRSWKRALRNDELIAYAGIVSAAVLFIGIDIYPRTQSAWESFRLAFFQVSTIITTTGYATTDFNLWPMFSHCILIFLMFVGACAGSTGGGIKVVRLVAAFKAMKREVQIILHPRAVRAVSLDGKPLDEGLLRSILTYIVWYVAIIIASVLTVALDGFDFETTFTAVMATISNIGPGLGKVGPVGNFGIFSDLSKMVMSFCMLVGRLEILPIFLLAVPSLWRRERTPKGM